jgi:hypothetical protein
MLDKGFEVFVNWQSVIFCLGIYFITFCGRTTVEATIKAVKVPGSVAYNLWTELFLPLGPFGVGMAIALLAKKFPWPMPIADITSAKLLYGIVCGGVSGFVYSRIRAWLGVAADSNSPVAQKFAAKLGAKSSTPSMPPAAPEDVKPADPPPVK